MSRGRKILVVSYFHYAFYCHCVLDADSLEIIGLLSIIGESRGSAHPESFFRVNEELMDIVALKTVLVIVPMPVNREVCPVEPVESVSCCKPYVTG